MSIITVSRGSHSRGKEVSEQVAEKLGYECISREVLVEASEEFNVPEVKLLHAIHDGPSVLDRFTFGKERYIAYIQAVLLDHFQRDNVVYHGLAGHFFVQNVSHVLKVRIIAEMEDRVSLVMQRDNLEHDEALRVLKSTDAARRKWSHHLYGIDTNDPSLYDLVIHIKKLSNDDAANMICHAASLGCFEATAESQQAMNDLLIASRVKASLVDRYPRINVTANDGVAYVRVEGATSRKENEIRDVVAELASAKGIDVRVTNIDPVVSPYANLDG